MQIEQRNGIGYCAMSIDGLASSGTRANRSLDIRCNRFIAVVMPVLVLACLAATRLTDAEELAETPGFSATDLEPSVRIEQLDNRTIEEYSVNDNVYMIKITPRYGAPYTLVDPDGTGEMEWRRDTLGMEVTPPRWTLFSW